VTSGTWFAPKAYGYGASPTNWKGWVATAAVCAITAILGYSLIGWTGDDHQPETWQWGLFLGLEALLIVGFVWLAKVKTAGEWRWRWGEHQ
jgi:hypothetical protein